MVLTNIDAAQTNGEEKDLETRLPHLPALENSLKQKAGSFMNRNIYAVLQDASCYYSYRIYPVITGTGKMYRIQIVHVLSFIVHVCPCIVVYELEQEHLRGTTYYYYSYRQKRPEISCNYRYRQNVQDSNCPCIVCHRPIFYGKLLYKMGQGTCINCVWDQILQILRFR